MKNANKSYVSFFFFNIILGLVINSFLFTLRTDGHHLQLSLILSWVLNIFPAVAFSVGISNIDGKKLFSIM
jgi:hypothetical protein